MNACIPMSSNNELKNFGFCEQLTLDNDKYYCSKCKFQFSLIIEDNQIKCKYIPSLFDFFYPYYYNPQSKVLISPDQNFFLPNHSKIFFILYFYY